MFSSLSSHALILNLVHSSSTGMQVIYRPPESHLRKSPPLSRVWAVPLPSVIPSYETRGDGGVLVRWRAVGFIVSLSCTLSPAIQMSLLRPRPNMREPSKQDPKLKGYANPLTNFMRFSELPRTCRRIDLLRRDSMSPRNNSMRFHKPIWQFHAHFSDSHSIHSH